MHQLLTRHLAGALPGAPDPLGHLLNGHLLDGGLAARPTGQHNGQAAGPAGRADGQAERRLRRPAAVAAGQARPALPTGGPGSPAGDHLSRPADRGEPSVRGRGPPTPQERHDGDRTRQDN